MKVTKNPNNRHKKIREEMTLKEIYDEFVKDADELKKITNGLINMYKTGRNAQTALNLAYYYMNEMGYFAEPITVQEYEWLEDATQGALIFSDPGYKGPAVKLDINSAYPYLYKSSYLMVPFKQGIFETVTEPGSFYKFGIWRAIVEYPKDNKKWWKLFKLNDSDKYTHYELNYAKKIGLKITLINDGEPNHLSYPRENCLNASLLFKKYTEYLYNIRKKHPQVAKRCKLLLNVLWGALCKKNEYDFIVDFETGVFPDLNGRILYSNTPLNDGRLKVTLLKEDKIYESNWARLKCFLLAKCRIMLGEYILPHVDNCFRAHTDSFLIGFSKDKIPPEYKISDEIGGLKIEDYWDLCHIKGLNDIVALKRVKKIVKKNE